jgi:hypothetical protein
MNSEITAHPKLQALRADHGQPIRASSLNDVTAAVERSLAAEVA